MRGVLVYFTKEEHTEFFRRHTRVEEEGVSQITHTHVLWLYFSFSQYYTRHRTIIKKGKVTHVHTKKSDPHRSSYTEGETHWNTDRIWQVINLKPVSAKAELSFSRVYNFKQFRYQETKSNSKESESSNPKFDNPRASVVGTQCYMPLSLSPRLAEVRGVP